MGEAMLFDKTHWMFMISPTPYRQETPKYAKESTENIVFGHDYWFFWPNLSLLWENGFIMGEDMLSDKTNWIFMISPTRYRQETLKYATESTENIVFGHDYWFFWPNLT